MTVSSQGKEELAFRKNKKVIIKISIAYTRLKHPQFMPQIKKF